MYMYISSANRALCFLQFARGFALLKIENRKEIDCGTQGFVSEIFLRLIVEVIVI